MKRKISRKSKIKARKSTFKSLKKIRKKTIKNFAQISIIKLCMIFTLFVAYIYI